MIKIFSHPENVVRVRKKVEGTIFNLYCLTMGMFSKHLQDFLLGEDK